VYPKEPNRRNAPHRLDGFEETGRRSSSALGLLGEEADAFF